MTLARVPLGEHDVLVTGSGLEADALNLAAAVDQLNSWGDGRLLLDGHVILTGDLAFEGAISMGGVTPAAELDIRSDSASPITWNFYYNPKTETTYSFSQDCEFADFFTPSGTTFSDGDWVCMWSNDVITDNAAHSGRTGNNYPMEIHQVHEWDGVNGQAYTADPIVYHMQTTPLFCKMTPSTGIHVFDLQMYWGGSGTMNDYQRAMYFKNCFGVRIYNVRFPRNGPGQIHISYCADVEIDRLSMFGQNNTESGYDGTYGITAEVVNGVRVTNSFLVGSRHAFTTAGTGSTTRWGVPLNCAVEGNTVLVPPVKFDDTPDWLPRVALDCHSEGYGVTFSDNDIYITATDSSTGINSRSRATVVKNNRIHGGHYSSVDRPLAQQGIVVCGKESVVEGNFVDRCAIGIRASTHSSDYQVYGTDIMIGRNTITNCTNNAILLVGDRAHVYQNKFRNCAYRAGTIPFRIKSLIQLGAPYTRTVSSFSGDTVTTTASHPWVVTQQVRFRTTGTLPTELSEGTYYWVTAETDDTLEVSETKGGTAITFTGGSGTHYVDGANLPAKDCIIEDNEGHKGDNDTFIACIGLDTDEITVTGNQATGYGVGTSIFDDTYSEAADMQAAWQHRNIVDGDEPALVQVTTEAGVTTRYATLTAAATALANGDTITIPPTGVGVTATVTIAADRVRMVPGGKKARIYRGTDSTDIIRLLYVTGDDFQCSGIEFDGIASGTNASIGECVLVAGDNARFHDVELRNAYSTGAAGLEYNIRINGASCRLSSVRSYNAQKSGFAIYGDNCSMVDCESIADTYSIYNYWSAAMQQFTVDGMLVRGSGADEGKMWIRGTNNPATAKRVVIDNLTVDLPNYTSGSAIVLVEGVQSFTLRNSCITHQADTTYNVFTDDDVERVLIDNCQLDGLVALRSRDATFSSVDTGTGVITCSASHGFSANQRVLWWNDTNPANVPTGYDGHTWYYVKNPSGATLELSLTPGGATVVPSDQGGAGSDYLFASYDSAVIRNSEISKVEENAPCLELRGGADVFELINCDVRCYGNYAIRLYGFPEDGKFDISKNRFWTDEATDVYVLDYIWTEGVVLFQDNTYHESGTGSILTVYGSAAMRELASRLEGSNRRDPAVVDVRDFGATGDGSTDDTAAIQAAIDAAEAIDGRVVGSAGDTYLVSSTLTAVGSIILDFRGCILRQDDSALLPAVVSISSSDGTQCTAYLHIDGNKANNSHTPLTSGTLTVGMWYEITTFQAGDDFQNVGAANNAEGEIFCAEATTPTTWTNSTTITPLTAGVQFTQHLSTGHPSQISVRNANVGAGFIGNCERQQYFIIADDCDWGFAVHSAPNVGVPGALTPDENIFNFSGGSLGHVCHLSGASAAKSSGVLNIVVENTTGYAVVNRGGWYQINGELRGAGTSAGGGGVYLRGGVTVLRTSVVGGHTTNCENCLYVYSGEFHGRLVCQGDYANGATLRNWTTSTLSLICSSAAGNDALVVGESGVAASGRLKINGDSVLEGTQYGVHVVEGTDLDIDALQITGSTKAILVDSNKGADSRIEVPYKTAYLACETNTANLIMYFKGAHTNSEMFDLGGAAETQRAGYICEYNRQSYGTCIFDGTVWVSQTGTVFRPDSEALHKGQVTITAGNTYVAVPYTDNADLGYDVTAADVIVSQDTSTVGDITSFAVYDYSGGVRVYIPSALGSDVTFSYVVKGRY